MPDRRADTHLIDPEGWFREVYPDLPWLMVIVENLRRAGIDRDPTVMLVVTHPAFPDSDPPSGLLWGLRAERGTLGVRVQRREVSS